MQKCLLCLAGVMFYYPALYSQYYFYDANHLEPEWRIEAGISLGLMNCLTDLGGHKGNGKKFLKDVNWKTSQACVGLFINATRKDVLGLRIEYTRGKVSASDSVLKGDGSAASLRYLRNLNFRSKLAELSTLMEFYLLNLLSSDLPLLSPYLIFGIGYFHFDPETLINQKWVRLQPLHTEGQGFKEFPTRMDYKLNQLSFPLGAGLKYDVSRFAVLRVEFVYRILPTDYLDDVSKEYIEPSLFYKYLSPEKAALAASLADRGKELNPAHRTIPGGIRGNPKNKDAFFSFSLKFSIVLNRKRL